MNTNTWQWGPSPFGINPPLGEGYLHCQWVEVRREDLGKAGSKVAGITRDPESLAFLARLLDETLVLPVEPEPMALWEGMLIRLGSGIMHTSAPAPSWELDRRTKTVHIRVRSREIGRYIGKGGANIKRVAALLAQVGWRIKVEEA